MPLSAGIISALAHQWLTAFSLQPNSCHIRKYSRKSPLPPFFKGGNTEVYRVHFEASPFEKGGLRGILERLG